MADGGEEGPDESGDEAELRRVLALAARKKEPHRFGAEHMAQVVIALRAGATFAVAAKAAGFSARTAERWRERSPAFAEACADAAAASDVPRLVAVSDGKGGYKVRRGRRHKFTEARKKAFLEHFAATLDAVAAAEIAEVCFATVYAHRRTDPAFAAAWEEAAAIGIARLGEEAARQRLAAMDRLRVDGDKQVPRDESDREFEKTMTFLRIYGARKGGGGGGGAGGPPLTKWSFEEAFAALDRELEVFRRKRAREAGRHRAPESGGGGDPGGGRGGDGRGEG